MITVTSKKDCCGCTACAGVCPLGCITMQADSEGFVYPVIDASKCINCGKCDKICPVQNREPETTPRKTAYIMRNNDADIVRNSTSGGATSAFCEAVVKEGGVVFGAVYDESFRVMHRCIDNAEQLELFRGSKYVQSNTEGIFAEVKKQLESGKKTLFIGTPCQVAGLKRYLGRDYDRLLTIDFVCHAVPSPMVWDLYRKTMEKKFGAPITSVNFREKSFGYHSSTITLTFANGKKSQENTLTDLMMKSFFDSISTRPSCHECAFRRADRVSDLTVFDCWNITRYVPSVKDDDKGYTAVLVHSDKGEELLKSVADKTVSYSADFDLLLQYCGVMALKNPPIHPQRDAFFEALNNGTGLEQAVKTYIPVKLSRKVFGKTKRTLHRLGILKLMKRIKAGGK